MKSNNIKIPYLDEEHLYNLYEQMRFANDRNMEEKLNLQKQVDDLMYKNETLSIDSVLKFSEYIDLKNSYNKAITTLKKIANEDFRGNRPQAAVDAYNTLKELNEIK